MMNYDLTKNKNMSLYEALYVAVREDILRGKLAPGEKLLSKRNLAERLNISITTIENAYAQLLLEGYIHTEPGRGVFVNELPGSADLRHRTPPQIQEQSSGEQNTEENPDADAGAAAAGGAQTPLVSSEETDSEYEIDFKANRSSMSLFPIATWSKLMRNVLSDRDSCLLKTVPYNGIYALRKSIADYLYRTHDIVIDPKQMIIGAGTEYLYSRLMQLFGRDSIIAMEDPGYKKFADISRHQGILWDYIPLDKDGISMAALEQSRANIVHVSPANHFPTGIVMPIHRRMELLNWANQSSGRFIIEDDYDSELRFVGRTIPPLYAIDSGQNVVYMNTFSKTLVPSIRISYMVLPERLLDRYVNTMSFYSCTVSAFEQLTLAKFISEGYFERHINRLKNHYLQKRKQVTSGFRQSKLAPIIKIEEANAGTHFLLHVNTRLSDEQIIAAASERGMELDMLSNYEYNRSIRNTGVIVINYAGFEEEKLSVSLEILSEIFQTDLLKYS